MTPELSQTGRADTSSEPGAMRATRIQPTAALRLAVRRRRTPSAWSARWYDPFQLGVLEVERPSVLLVPAGKTTDPVYGAHPRSRDDPAACRAAPHHSGTSMKTLGIIGGIAPPSTIDYYQRLIAGYRAASPDGSYPLLLLDSIDAARFFRLLEADDRVAMTDLLVAEVGRLVAAGADAALFASNTPHMVFDEVAARSPIPLISLVEETARVAEAQGLGGWG